MKLFKNIFKQSAEKQMPSELIKLEEFISKFSALINLDKYIAKSDFRPLLADYDTIYNYLSALKKSEMLNAYCKTNKFDISIVKKFFIYFETTDTIIDERNENYISNKIIEEKEYLDNILKEIDPQILLDDDQRKAVLTDEDYCLIIAGAGAGKTTTVAAKVKYLVEKEGIEPKQILVISFTNKAVKELRDRINKNLKIDCPITTFHSTGNAILRKQSDEVLNIKEDSFLYKTVNDYLRKQLLDSKMLDNLMLFFGSYFDSPYSGDDLKAFFNTLILSDTSTLKSNINEFQKNIIDIREKKKITINNEYLRSIQEVRIANFLFMNGIDYDYEATYPYHIFLARKPYNPDFKMVQDNKVVYLEHFGITESGTHKFYSIDELEKYKKAINDKINIHKTHGTKLIYTFSQYNDGQDYIEHLKTMLIIEGIQLRPRSNEEIYSKIALNEENKYMSKLVALLCRFISNFKTNGYTEDTFYLFMRKNPNVRTKLFLDIARGCYLQYQRRLQEENAVDFQDMINDSARILKEYKTVHEKLDFKYIIVDEYQDISRQRFDLTKELSAVTNAKIVAVGDDWQSIYAFSGSDISLFTQFCKKMGYGKELKIIKTYRNSQEVIDIAGDFVQKNESQIKKTLLANKHIVDPVIIYSFDDKAKKYSPENNNEARGALYMLANGIQTALTHIVENNNGNQNKDILLIGRYGFDGQQLEKSNLFDYQDYGNKIICKKYPKIKIQFMTAHSSKGLGYDDVIIINTSNSTFGFPCKIDDDPVLKLVTHEDTSIQFAEERRLFYVAMTRTKNRVYMITPENKPSEFVLELIKNYKNIVLDGELKESETQLLSNKLCPICGYPLKYRMNNTYGLKLYMCTNESEICNFISNDLHGGIMAIQKCDKCQDGYLIVKQKKDGGTILGCTNYTPDKKGCNNVVDSTNFEKQYLNNQGELLEIEIADEENIEYSENKSKNKQKNEDNKLIESKAFDAQVAGVNELQNKETCEDEAEDDELCDDETETVNGLENCRLKGLALELRKYAIAQGEKEGLIFWKVLRQKVINQIVINKPTSIEELQNIKGIGTKKINSYGEDIIKIVKEYHQIKDSSNSKIHKKSYMPDNVDTVVINGYNFICDENGEIITDKVLFEKLRILRYDLSIDENLPAYCIISNLALVGLATYKPKTYDDWVVIKGLRDRTYNKYGELFIKSIMEYEES